MLLHSQGTTPYAAVAIKTARFMATIRTTSNSPKILTVKLDGPHPAYSESKDVLADCKHRKLGGIYFWAIKVGDSYRITHIGQTSTSFYQRMKEHIINTLGGNYRISDPNALKRGESEIIWDGLWREGTREKLPEFLRDSTNLFEMAKANLKLENIFVAPLEVEDRMRRRIEGAIANHIRKDKTASSLLPKDIRVLGRLTTETAIPVKISAGVKILGLPEELDV
jgi:hypothetical protein